jgi:hypothetical protein
VHGEAAPLRARNDIPIAGPRADPRRKFGELGSRGGPPRSPETAGFSPEPDHPPRDQGKAKLPDSQFEDRSKVAQGQPMGTPGMTQPGMDRGSPGGQAPPGPSPSRTPLRSAQTPPRVTGLTVIERASLAALSRGRAAQGRTPPRTASIEQLGQIRKVRPALSPPAWQVYCFGVLWRGTLVVFDPFSPSHPMSPRRGTIVVTRTVCLQIKSRPTKIRIRPSCSNSARSHNRSSMSRNRSDGRLKITCLVRETVH